MADLKLNTTNGSVTLKPEDGGGNVDVTIPRAGVGKVLQFISVPLNSTTVSTTVNALNQNWSSWPTLISTQITPLSDNSVFLVNFQTNIQGFSGTGGPQFGIFSTKNGVLDIALPVSGRTSNIESMGLWFTSTSLSNRWTPVSFTGEVQNDSLNTFTIDARLASENGSTVQANHDRYGPAYMNIIEIAN